MAGNGYGSGYNGSVNAPVSSGNGSSNAPVSDGWHPPSFLYPDLPANNGSDNALGSNGNGSGRLNLTRGTRPDDLGTPLHSAPPAGPGFFRATYSNASGMTPRNYNSMAKEFEKLPQFGEPASEASDKKPRKSKGRQGSEAVAGAASDNEPTKLSNKQRIMKLEESLTRLEKESELIQNVCKELVVMQIRETNKSRRKQNRHCNHLDNYRTASLRPLLDTTTGNEIEGFPKTMMELICMGGPEIDKLAAALDITAYNYSSDTERRAMLRDMIRDKISGSD